MRGPRERRETVRVLSSLQARVALLILVPVVIAAGVLLYVALEEPGFLALAGLGALTLIMVRARYDVLMARNARTLADAAERLAAGDVRARTGLDRNEAGELGRLAGTFDDMAEAMEHREDRLHVTLKELWRSWREAQRATEETEVEEAREALFSSMTHDLRSPLTSIKAASTLLIQYDGNLPEDERGDLLETIRESADGLDRLITNAVQLSRTRAGGLTPHKTPAAIDEVASRALDRLRHRLADHQVVLVIPEDLPEVEVDVVHLDQALTNLLENAARFSPPGSEIAVSLLPHDGTLLIRVEDHGTGIPPGERDRVFEPFVKLGNGGGAGLGLPISRAIAEAHGGRVIIESSPGGGTAVVMELPLNGHAISQRSAGRGP